MAELEAESAPAPRKREVAAGPKKRGRAAPRTPPSPDRIEELVRAVVTSLESDGAEDVVVLDVATRSSFADRMVVATGLVERQIEAMAGHVEDALADLGIRRLRTEASPDWVLLDAGDLVIHLFKPEARANYAIERMWGPDSPAAESAENSMPEPSEEGDDGDEDEEDGEVLPIDEVLDGPAGTTLGHSTDEEGD
ncbi:ribosome silencing factor [Roseomonas nepalensis]|uniref:Ribosomal silencing factor RsfS n=1 Tax=Muricoccus nepalensis TaxID=1854500 RepID=A0A502EJ11_9PROT|nr:ribosome silencing factor [Roseomonas nepalensis]